MVDSKDNTKAEEATAHVEEDAADEDEEKDGAEEINEAEEEEVSWTTPLILVNIVS